MAQPPPYPTQGQPPYPSKEQEAGVAPLYPPQAGAAPAYPPQTGAAPAYPPAAAQPPPATAYPAAYPAAQPVAQPAAASHTTVVVTSNTMVMGHMPMTGPCSRCGNTVTSMVTQQPGTFAWIACFVIAIVGCWMGCCLIPFCISDMQDTVHTCPNCRNTMGVSRRM